MSPSALAVLLLLLLLQLLLHPPALCVDLIIIGDSTAAIADSDKYPREGWGAFLGDHVSSSSGIVVRDAARAGRSSKSFYTQGLWADAKSKYLSAGDYVLIQFGHNDQKSGSRHTDPFTTYQDYLTTYVDDTRAAGAFPVLLTPIARADWHKGSLEQTLGDYPAAVRQLAARLKVPLVDMNADTSALFSRLGQQVTQTELFMVLPAGKYPNWPHGLKDTTHLQVAGAKQVAAVAAQGLANANLPISSAVTNIGTV